MNIGANANPNSYPNPTPHPRAPLADPRARPTGWTMYAYPGIAPAAPLEPRSMQAQHAAMQAALLATGRGLPARGATVDEQVPAAGQARHLHQLHLPHFHHLLVCARSSTGPEAARLLRQAFDVLQELEGPRDEVILRLLHAGHPPGHAHAFLDAALAARDAACEELIFACCEKIRDKHADSASEVLQLLEAHIGRMPLSAWTISTISAAALAFLAHLQVDGHQAAELDLLWRLTRVLCKNRAAHAGVQELVMRIGQACAVAAAAAARSGRAGPRRHVAALLHTSIAAAREILDANRRQAQLQGVVSVLLQAVRQGVPPSVFDSVARRLATHACALQPPAALRALLAHALFAHVEDMAAAKLTHDSTQDQLEILRRALAWITLADDARRVLLRMVDACLVQRELTQAHPQRDPLAHLVETCERAQFIQIVAAVRKLALADNGLVPDKDAFLRALASRLAKAYDALPEVPGKGVGPAHAALVNEMLACAAQSGAPSVQAQLEQLALQRHADMMHRAAAAATATGLPAQGA